MAPWIAHVCSFRAQKIVKDDTSAALEIEIKILVPLARLRLVDLWMKALNLALLALVIWPLTETSTQNRSTENPSNDKSFTSEAYRSILYWWHLSTLKSHGHVSSKIFTLRCSRFRTKDVRQLVTAERHLLPKCTNFGFFTTKVYEFWVFYYQNVRILDLFIELYEYWDVTWRPGRPSPYIRACRHV